MSEGQDSTSTTGRHAGLTPPLEFTRRDWRPQFAAVVVPSLLYAGVTVVVLSAVALAPGEGWLLRLVQQATVLGRGVIAQLGWVFGILITVQLGCLIAVLGGQIHTRTRRDEADLRAALGLFSALPIIGLSPALTVASIAAFRVGELRGALFVIVPAVALTVALSVFVGTFDVADELTKKAFAESDEERALEDLAVLRKLDTAPFWETVLYRSVQLFLLTAGACFFLMVITRAPATADWVVLSFATLMLLSSTGTMLAFGVVSASLKPTRSATGFAVTGILLVAVIAMQVIVCRTLFVLQWQLGVSAVFGGLVLVIMAMRVLAEAREVRAGRVPAGRWRRGGKLAHAGTTMARRSAEKKRDDAKARIATLTQMIDRRVAEEPSSEGRRHEPEGGTVNG